MVCKRAALFRGRHFTDEIIVLCVRWYLRYSLSYRDLTEIMRERNLFVDPSTIWRWVQRYAPELNTRIDPPLDRTMILFHYVVQIRNDSAVTPSTESTLVFQFVNDRRI